eukprot:1832755-Rhodomonas_salina.1
MSSMSLMRFFGSETPSQSQIRLNPSTAGSGRPGVSTEHRASTGTAGRARRRQRVWLTHPCSRQSSSGRPAWAARGRSARSAARTPTRCTSACGATHERGGATMNLVACTQGRELEGRAGCKTAGQ